MIILIDTNPCEHCELAPAFCGMEIEYCMRRGPYSEGDFTEQKENERIEENASMKEAHNE